MEQLIAKARLYALENAKSYQEVFEALGLNQRSMKRYSSTRLMASSQFVFQT